MAHEELELPNLVRTEQRLAQLEAQITNVVHLLNQLNLELVRYKAMFGGALVVISLLAGILGAVAPIVIDHLM